MISDIVSFLNCPMSREEYNALWVDGSIVYEDAKVLYTLVTHYKPETIIEFGTFIGLSAKIMAMAVRSNGFGKIKSIDIINNGENASHYTDIKKGGMLSEEDMETVTMEQNTMYDYLSSCPDSSVDMILEDTDHHAETIISCVPGLLRVLKPGGVLVFHDSLMPAMQAGFKQSGISDKMFYFHKINGSGIGGFVK